MSETPQDYPVPCEHLSLALDDPTCPICLRTDRDALRADAVERKHAARLVEAVVKSQRDTIVMLEESNVALRAEMGSLEARNRRIAGFGVRMEAALREMHALLPAVMDALESDAQLDVRRAAFESIQEAYAETHPWGAALHAPAPAEQDWDPVYGDPRLALRKVAGILRNESFALRVEAALDVIDEALS